MHGSQIRTVAEALMMGRVYGVQGRAWRKLMEKPSISYVKLWFNNVTKVKTDDYKQKRQHLFNPDEFDLGCLRPCMHTHTFSQWAKPNILLVINVPVMFRLD